MSHTAEPRTRSVGQRWAAKRWPALVAAVLGVPLVLVAVASSLYWPGRVFPGFFVLADRVVPTVGLFSWTGVQAALPFHSQVIAVDGRPVGAASDVYDHAALTAEGTVVHYEVEKDGQRKTFAVPTMRFSARDWWLTFGLFVLNGMLVLGAGITVAVLRPTTDAARAFLAFGWCSGFLMLTAPPLYHPGWSWLTPLNLFAQCVWPASFFHLGLVFPVMRPFIARRRAWLVVPYAVSAALTVAVLRGFYAPHPDFAPIYLAFGYTALSMIGLAALLALAYVGDATPLTRARLRVVLPGFVMSSALACFGFVDNARGGGTFPINLSVLCPVFFYAAVGYAIARYDLFDIDRFVKQAAVYVTLTALITGGYALLLLAFGWLPALRVLGSSPVTTIAFVVLVAIAFEPLRRRIQALADRTFFRRQVDYAATVREASAMLTTVLDLDDVLARVGAIVDTGLSPTSLAVLLWLDAGPRLWRLAGGTASGEAAVDPAAPLRALLVDSPVGSWQLPAGDVELPYAAEARRTAAALGVTLVVPLRIHDRVIGTFLLGSKRSGLLYDRGDRDLLETLAAQGAVAIQNAILFGEVQQLNADLEAKVRTRTAELERSYRELQDTQAQLLHSEKLASLGQLVAGVAHEINTPVTAIVGNVKPLWTELARLRDRAALHGDPALEQIAARMKAIFEVMARGAERTAGIVQDLRVFSRVGEARPLPMDVQEAIDVSLRLLRPRWADRIVVHRDYGELPPVEAAAGPINQVLMNLLANACDAIDGRGNIWVRTRAADGVVSIAVRDDGCGIAREHLGRIFDPFFTTKPIGRGTGLGLAISSTIVRDHGGTIAVDSAPGRGATFTVTLPVHAVAQEEPPGAGERGSR